MCVSRIIQINQQPYRTGIGIYATEQSLRIRFHGDWNILRFLISAISVDPQNSAKIKQPQKIPVIRYYNVYKSCMYL